MHANLESLKEKTTRKTSEKVILISLNNLPNKMLTEHGDVTITIDIMYINKILFMMTTSWSINFGSAEMNKNKTKSTILK